MQHPVNTLWDTHQPWNFTNGCGGRMNTPGPEKKGAYRYYMGGEQMAVDYPERWPLESDMQAWQ
jgi:hypothetical protein